MPDGKRPGSENLIPNSMRAKEEARQISRKGGIQSGKVRRQKKALREALITLLSAPLSSDLESMVDDLLEKPKKKKDVQDAVLAATIRKGIESGDPRVLSVIHHILGEDSVQPENNEGVTIIDDIQAD